MNPSQPTEEKKVPFSNVPTSPNNVQKSGELRTKTAFSGEQRTAGKRRFNPVVNFEGRDTTQIPKYGKILNVIAKLENNGRKPATTYGVSKNLIKLSRSADLDNPEDVKHWIAKADVKESYKASLVSAYNTYCKHFKLEWEKPTYSREAQQFKSPPTEKINFLIVNAQLSLSIKLQLSKLGLDPIEVITLTPDNFDFALKTVSPTLHKRRAKRVLRVDERLLASVEAYIKKHNIGQNERIFPISEKSYSHIYRKARDRLIEKTGDQSLKQIRLYDFRHYAGTQEALRTNGNTAAIAYKLGHKDWKNTKIYVDILQVLQQLDTECDVKWAKTKDEITRLMAAGYTYVKDLDMDGEKCFKKHI